MMLEQGQRYRAKIKLGFFESKAPDTTLRAEIAKRIEAAGFEGVLVWGAGSDWWADGTWASANTYGALPERVVSLELAP